ncbi:hypothetical protein BKH43_06580 [Helicobacter sp. 13S00401-1]|uniref:hypothetical protein n=1 Tax=Helicobacter sp. 13S00401-1 TaxID=1905758 RepID=UPI000BA5E4C4|nr:hypothetical protein [Helicobacter sp. 13S00401-1]PAF49667.1 hypothetical protein BKH43_06580 [Helicobacter sp. 13S00401-1]
MKIFQLRLQQTRCDLLNHFYFLVLLTLHVIILLVMINEISIYYKEALLVAKDNSLPAYIANLSIEFFGHNDFALRVPFLILHIINTTLLYLISLKVVRRKEDALLVVFIFMLIPGVNIIALLVSKSSIILLITLLIVFLKLYFRHISYVLFIVISFLDSSGAVLLLSLFFYGLIFKNIKILVFSIVFFGINMYIFSPIRGVPEAYFLDTLGLFAMLLSPLLFIYYCYAIYDSVLSKATLLNLIPFVGIIFILLLSTRQEIDIESFFPPLLVGLPLLVVKILSDIRLRLKVYARAYTFRLVIILIVAFLSTALLLGNKITYLFTKEPNFAYSFYEAKEIAHDLKAMGITHIQVYSDTLRERLKFYGISNGDRYKLEPFYPRKNKTFENAIVIKYLGEIIHIYEVKPIKRQP